LIAQSTSGSVSKAEVLSFWNPEDTYIWPTNASRYASATFGETRSGHFHAALDMKTWGRKGYKVYATRSGIVHYISIGPKGYGKVVYLKHNDGSLSVYAHLMEFAPKIRAVVDSLRLQTYDFDFERDMEPFAIHVEQGEVIAYTGESGVGPPHLHFELRTPDNRPFNPLLTNLSIADHRAPQFSALSIEPLSADALIYGEKTVKTLGPTVRNGIYDFGTAQVTGTVGLGVDVFDKADKVYNVYAVYKLAMKVDDQLRFEAKVDSFSYKNTDQMFLDRVYPILQKSRDGYQRTFITDGNTLPFYNRALGNGQLRLSPGKHQVEIIATDYFGNSSTARLTLDVLKDAPLSSRVRRRQNHTNGHAERNSPYHIDRDFIWANNWVASRSNDELRFLPWGSFKSHNSYYSNSMRHAVSIEGGSGWLKDSHGHKTRLHRIIPGQSSTLYTDNHRFRIHFPADMVYDTLSVGAFDQSGSDSLGLALWPDHAPFRPPFHISTVLPKSDTLISKKAFYAKSLKNGDWQYITTHQNGHTLTAEADRFGPYRVLTDLTKPTIEQPRLYRRADGHWVAQVRVLDERSGVDYTNAEIYCNGLRGIPEFDPENDYLIFYHPDFKPEEKNTLRVVLPDQAGNVRDKEFELPLR
jgi:hypothetical protein